MAREDSVPGAGGLPAVKTPGAACCDHASPAEVFQPAAEGLHIHSGLRPCRPARREQGAKERLSGCGSEAVG